MSDTYEDAISEVYRHDIANANKRIHELEELLTNAEQEIESLDEALSTVIERSTQRFEMLDQMRDENELLKAENKQLHDDAIEVTNRYIADRAERGRH